MSEPIKAVVTDMRKFLGVFGMDNFSPSLSSNRGSINRKINRQLFMPPISGRKRKISEENYQDNFSGFALRTPNRKSQEDEVDYEEEENEFNGEQTEMIFSREEKILMSCKWLCEEKLLRKA